MTSSLTSAQIAELHELLLQRKHAVHERLQQVQDGQSRVEHARAVLQQESGGDARQNSSDREVNLAMSDMGAVDLARINAALARIVAGTYGDCEECGCTIAYERLKIEPMTQHCVSCKSQWEKDTGRVPTSNM